MWPDVRQTRRGWHIVESKCVRYGIDQQNHCIKSAYIEHYLKPDAFGTFWEHMPISNV